MNHPANQPTNHQLSNPPCSAQFAVQSVAHAALRPCWHASLALWRGLATLLLLLLLLPN